MDRDDTVRLRQLLGTEPVAALGTLHRGEPALSMVPFVLPGGANKLIIHVSALATHTQDMRAHPRVGLLITSSARAGVAAQALPRVSLQADARELTRDGDEYAPARACYLARFADAAMTFELADFSLFALQPVSARLIAGFGRAHSLVGEQLAAWLRDGGR
jgi:heme iron utilization protein